MIALVWELVQKHLDRGDKVFLKLSPDGHENIARFPIIKIEDGKVKSQPEHLAGDTHESSYISVTMSDEDDERYGFRKTANGYEAFAKASVKEMKTIKKPQTSGGPFDFAAPEVKFKKLDDLPKSKPNTAAEVMNAMKALHKMVHAQAHAYGGKHGKLLPVGIAENSLLKSFEMIAEDGESGVDPVGSELDSAYEKAHALVDHLAHMKDPEGMTMLLDVLKHLNRALDLVKKV